MNKTTKPTLVIVSDWIRRDLHEPLRHFQKFKIVHLYRQAGYQDMKPEDFESPKAIQWLGPIDLWQKIQAAKPDILQGGEPWANRSSLLITFVTCWYKKTHPKVKLIWPSMENRPIIEKFSWLESKLLSLWTKIYGRSSDLVMYLNKGARQNLIKAGVPESKLKKVMWATWGVDCGEFSPQSSLKTKKLKDIKTILFVGKVSEAKGVPWLIEAFQDVKRKVKDVKLVLAGPLDKNFQLPSYVIARSISDKAISNKGIATLPPVARNDSSIEYLGIIKNKDLPDLFRQADVVVAPSITTKIWEEQVGMVNLQAMACGIPVITTKSGAIPEFVRDGEGAILVPEKDSRAIAKVLLELLTDENKRSSLGNKAREFVCNHYEVKGNIESVERIMASTI